MIDLAALGSGITSCARIVSALADPVAAVDRRGVGGNLAEGSRSGDLIAKSGHPTRRQDRPYSTRSRVGARLGVSLGVQGLSVTVKTTE
jgi:hypothetical protein